MEESQASMNTKYKNFKGKSIKEILELQSQLGTKKFAQKITKHNESATCKSNSQIHCEIMDTISDTDGKMDKSKPIEMRMIKKPIPTHRFKNKMSNTNIGTSKCRDPRFHELSGILNMDKWRKNFTFLSDKRKQEKLVLMEALNKCSNKNEKIEMTKTIHKIQNQEREHGKQEKLKIMKREEKEKAIQSLKEGKKPYFTSDVQKKKQINAEYVKGLKNKDKYFIRKEKKLAMKEKKRNLVPHTEL